MKRIILSIFAIAVISAVLIYRERKSSDLNSIFQISSAKASSQDPKLMFDLKNTNGVANQQSHQTPQNKSVTDEKKESQTLAEVLKLKTEIDDLYNKTQFDSRNMTRKEYEDAIELLRIYNQKIRLLINETSEALKS